MNNKIFISFFFGVILIFGILFLVSGEEKVWEQQFNFGGTYDKPAIEIAGSGVEISDSSSGGKIIIFSGENPKLEISKYAFGGPTGNSWLKKSPVSFKNIVSESEAGHPTFIEIDSEGNILKADFSIKPKSASYYDLGGVEFLQKDLKGGRIFYDQKNGLTWKGNFGNSLYVNNLKGNGLISGENIIFDLYDAQGTLTGIFSEGYRWKENIPSFNLEKGTLGFGCRNRFTNGDCDEKVNSNYYHGVFFLIPTKKVVVDGVQFDYSGGKKIYFGTDRQLGGVHNDVVYLDKSPKGLLRRISAINSPGEKLIIRDFKGVLNSVKINTRNVEGKPTGQVIFQDKNGKKIKSWGKQGSLQLQGDLMETEVASIQGSGVIVEKTEDSMEGSNSFSVAKIISKPIVDNFEVKNEGPIEIEVVGTINPSSVVYRKAIHGSVEFEKQGGLHVDVLRNEGKLDKTGENLFYSRSSSFDSLQDKIGFLEKSGFSSVEILDAGETRLEPAETVIVRVPVKYEADERPGKLNEFYLRQGVDELNYINTESEAIGQALEKAVTFSSVLRDSNLLKVDRGIEDFSCSGSGGCKQETYKGTSTFRDKEGFFVKSYKVIDTPQEFNRKDGDSSFVTDSEGNFIVTSMEGFNEIWDGERKRFLTLEEIKKKLSEVRAESEFSQVNYYDEISDVIYVKVTLGNQN